MDFSAALAGGNLMGLGGGPASSTDGAHDSANEESMKAAIGVNDADKVKELLAGGVDVRTTVEKRRSFLHLAAVHDASAVASVLLHAGADVEHRDSEKGTPLHAAVESHAFTVLKVLLEAGADPNALAAGRRAPLHCAAAHNYLDLATILLRYGANAALRDGLQRVASEVASKRPEEWRETIRSEQLTGDKLDAAEKQRALNTVKRMRSTPWDILQSARYGNTERLLFLIDEASGEGEDDGGGGSDDGSDLSGGSGGDGVWQLVSSEDATGHTALHLAAQLGEDRGARMVQALVDSGAAVDARNAKDMTPLHCAATSNAVECATVLVLAGAAVDAANGNENTPLHVAATHNADAVCALLLHHGADVNHTDGWGQTALYKAASNNSMAVLDQLLMAGATVDLVDTWQSTALKCTAEKNFQRAAQKLLAYGADPQLLAREGRSPLGAVGTDVAAWKALFKEHALSDQGRALKVKQQAERLARRGADGGGGSGASFVTHHTVVRLVNEHRVEELRKALTSLTGAPDALDEADAHGNTVLHVAATKNHSDTLAVLLEAGANVDTKGWGGVRALHVAAENDAVECAHLLLEAGARVDVRDQWLYTPLHKAAMHNAQHVAKQLLSAGADAEALNNNNEIPFMCVESDVGVWKEMLDSYSLKSDHLHNRLQKQRDKQIARDVVLTRMFACRAAKHGDDEWLLRLLTGEDRTLVQADANWCDDNGDTLLHVGVANGHPYVLAALLEHGADVNRANRAGNTPLHAAVLQGNAEVLALLLHVAAADTEVKDAHQRTALHLCAEGNLVEAAEMLLGVGADLHAREKSKDTPLHKAVFHNHLDIGRALVAAGASLTEENMYSTLPMDRTQKASVKEVWKGVADDAPGALEGQELRESLAERHAAHVKKAAHMREIATAAHAKRVAAFEARCEEREREFTAEIEREMNGGTATTTTTTASEGTRGEETAEETAADVQGDAGSISGDEAGADTAALLAENAALRAENDELRAVIAQLRAELAAK